MNNACIKMMDLCLNIYVYMKEKIYKESPRDIHKYTHKKVLLSGHFSVSKRGVPALHLAYGVERVRGE
jgi:hypothetical protein